MIPAMAAESPKTVLIFRSEMLAMSETFILAQAKALRRFMPRFVGLHRVGPSLKLPADLILAADGEKLRHKCRLRLYKEAGLAAGFHSEIRRAEGCLLHAHFAVDGVLALPIVKRLRVPLIVTLHGFDVTVSDRTWSHSRTGRLYLQRRRQLWEQAAAFICVSEFIRERARNAGFPDAKLRTHHIGVNRSEFGPRQSSCDPGSVLFVGRLVEKKGCDVLLRAMHSVQEQLPFVRLTIVGDGPMHKSLAELAGSLGVRCEFVGATSSAHVRQLLRQTAIVCVPSRTAENGDSEGLPIFVLEAQSMGVPVVSTCHAGIPEAIIHGETGLLAKEGDPRALATHLISLLQSEELQSAYASRGMQRMAESFDLERQTSRLEDIYEEVLGC